MDSLKGGERKVCQIRRALYGLKQAGRQWNKRLDQELKRLNFKPLRTDPCLYHLKENEQLGIIAVYVDDVIIAASSDEFMKKIKCDLMAAFKMKDEGSIHYCLGIEFIQKEDFSVFMSQKRSSEKILKDYAMQDCNVVKSPMDHKLQLLKSSEPSDPKIPYRALIGSLMYLSITTRPDITFAVNYLSQFNSCYNSTHWEAAKRILRYIKGTITYGLQFQETTEMLYGSIDSDWGEDKNDRKSYTGVVFVMSGGPVVWRTRKQQTVALSSTEAEYMALTEGLREAKYLRNVLSELDLLPNPQVIYNDNKGAEFLVKNPAINDKSKHIDIKFHYIRDEYNNKIIDIVHKPSEDILADIFTKSLSPVTHTKLVKSLNMQM